MFLVARARGEVEKAVVSEQTVIPGRERPEPVDGDRHAVDVAQLADDSTSVGVEDVDPSIPEVADEQIAGVLPEGRRTQGESPGRIESPLGGNPAEEVALRVEHADE